MGTEKTIYFICAGTSSYDIINSINNTVDKKGGGFFTFFEDKNGKKNNKLEKDDFPKLENNGIKEIYMCQDNKYNMELFKNYSKIYTSMDYSNIESSIVFSSSNTKNVEIYPIPYIAKDTNIKDLKIYKLFKTSFGESVKNELKIKYWNEKIPFNKFTNIKKKFPKINWEYVDNSGIVSLHTYSFSKFNNFLNIVLNDPDNKNNDNLIFICNAQLIVDILKSFRNEQYKYNSKIDIIEKSSIWEVKINKESSKKFTYTKYDKKYPTEYNDENLNYNGKTYTYTNDKNKYILFNALESIPAKYIKKMEFYRISENIKKIIKNRLRDIVNNENKNENNTTQKKNIKNLLKFNF
jgi:hypothetical protein